MLSSFVLAATIFLSSLAAATIALFLLSRLTGAARRQPGLLPQGDGYLEQAVFLFDGKELVDATRPARALLSCLVGERSDWGRLTDYLSRSIDGLPNLLAHPQDGGEVELTGNMGAAISVKAEWFGGMTRLTVNDTTHPGVGVLVEGICLRAQDQELTELRECLSQAPMLIWHTDDTGMIVCANTAYLDKLMERDGLTEDSLTWPIPALFVHHAPHTDVSRRISIGRTEHMEDAWYDCHSYASGEGTLYYAIPADSAVRAERSQREFVQTLTKTFAHVPIGLAIFDRSRRLQLFNPALLDLTGLEFDFLSARPGLPTFLDRLREARIIPEPKDYGLWRQQMAELERAASSGHFEETWILPTGRTYQVTGHPHADGSLAFLFEDISTEIEMTQNFRSELQLSQTVIDTLDEAIAVFSAAGDMIMSNAAYAALWEVDPAATLGSIRIPDMVRHWQTMTLPNPAWGDIRDFVGAFDERADWFADAVMRDGRGLECRVIPLQGGATLVGFSVHPALPPKTNGSRDKATRPATETI